MSEKGVRHFGRTAVGRALRWGVIVLILAAPSVWLLRTVPPLWRDVDAYAQLTGPPGTTTLLQHGPLYCFGARVPLYLGHLISGLGGAPVRSIGEFMRSATLDDAGIFALLLSQHAALCGAQLFLLANLSPVFWVRALVALAFATNPLLYTFAHSVGSEALSAIGTIVLVVLGLRIARSRTATSRMWWSFAVVLTLLMLTRQINAVLAALLPLAFLLALFYRSFVAAVQRDQRQRKRARVEFYRAATATAIGAACLITSMVSVRVLCASASVPYRSKMGFTFLWRLAFLQHSAPDERMRVLEQMRGDADSDEGRKLVQLLGESLQRGERFDVVAFVNSARAELFPPGTKRAVTKMDAALNEMASKFLRSGDRSLRNVALDDFRNLRRMTVRSVTEFLFLTTTYYFDHQADMPGASHLVTFRNSTAEEVMSRLRQHPCFRWWSGLKFNGWLRVWALCGCLLLWLSRAKQGALSGTASYATALVLVGLLMMLLQCFLTEALPRYALPMMQLLFLSLAIVVSQTAVVLGGDAASSISEAHNPQHHS